MASLGGWMGLDRTALIHGLRLALAAWVAFAIASMLHVGNAYWAAMPIFVVTQSAKGLLIERAFFRVAGTLAGAACGFAILRTGLGLVPVLALLAVVVALNATLVHLLRGVHAYGALLAGMTAAVIVLPTLFQPDQSLTLAAARLENTLIGVAVVTVVTGFWTPSAPRDAFYARVRKLGRDAVLFAAAQCGDMREPDLRRQEWTLLRALSEAQANAVQVTAGSMDGYRRLHDLHILTVSAIGVMAARPRPEPGTRVALKRAIEDVASALGRQDAGTAATADAAAMAAIRDADPPLAKALGDLLDAEARLAVARGQGKGQPRDVRPGYRAVRLDYRLAVEAGLIAGGATFGSSLLAVWSGWPAGQLAALGVCIFSMVLGSLPAPERVAPIMLKGVLAGILAALVYRFGLQPHVTTVPALLASLVPFLLAGGLARASTKTAAPALDANMCFLLASQAVLPPVTNPAAILSGSAALLLAALVVTPAFILMPPRARREAAHTRAALRDDLLRMARPGKPPAAARQQQRAVQQILRLALHVEKAAGDGHGEDGSLIATLRLGQVIQQLKAVDHADGPGAPTARIILDTLQTLGRDPGGCAARLEALAAECPEGNAGLAREASTALRATGRLLAV